ncbi:unnamed protein product [Bursaphelenchus xylophilus]|uniref:(pine wood nematode) hypothetical protein n=1 Tax=Bursaphelenchus xylophilus TaxID=6326 RepID=A0A7I8WGI8_BURXY|nr:unnamed protein product [Bursaphelenchus xylophilus]CAG9111106.1 unnamed protein product [Bursaphelenchus xylophilus]
MVTIIRTELSPLPPPEQLAVAGLKILSHSEEPMKDQLCTLLITFQDFKNPKLQHTSCILGHQMNCFLSLTIPLKNSVLLVKVKVGKVASAKL